MKSKKLNIILQAVVSGLFVMALFVYLPGCASSKSNFDKLAESGGEVRTFEVFGMDCPGCHGGLEKLIDKIPGVKGSKANWDMKKLTVLLHPDAKVDDDAIYEAIKQANFTPGKGSINQ